MSHRKITPVVLVCLLVLLTHSMVHAAMAPQEQIVLALHAKDIMVGFGDGYMGWDETLTRAQAVKIIVTAMGYSERARESVTLHPEFPDVGRAHWAFRFVNLACEFGIVKGFPDGSFRPEKQVTRAEYLVMLSRMYTALGGVGVISAGLPLIEPKWMAEEVLQVPDLISVLKPKQGESFDSDILRAEAGILVYGLMEKFGLIYDLIGTVIEVRPNEIAVSAHGLNETVSIPLSSDTKCVQGANQVGIDKNIAGKEAHIILGKFNVCVLLRIE